MSERVKKAVKEIRKYEESKMRAIDEFFLELEKNPYAHMPDGFSEDDLEIKEAWMQMNRAKREITVLVTKMTEISKKLSAIIFSLMENPLYDDELAVCVINDMQMEINRLKDQVQNNEWDIEFYEWWLESVRNGEVVTGD